METYNYNDFKEAGIDVEFVQDNQSSSRYGVLRGLHFQLHYPQDKLVRVVNGEVFDVAVDLREGSKLMENGTELFFQQRIRNSFLFRKDLHMASWFFLRMLSLLTNAPIFIIQTMRAV